MVLAGRADRARRGVSRFGNSVIVLSLVAAGAVAAVQPAAAAAAATTGTTVVPRHSDIGSAMKRAANYYRPLYPVGTGTKAGWSWSTYFQGVHALYGMAGDYRYLTDAMSWGRSNSWSLSREAKPDALKAGQVYYDLHQIDPTASLASMDTHMSADLANAPVTSYYWIDGLFMGLPNWTRWATRTGNSAYLDKMDALYRWTRDNGITADCPGAAPDSTIPPSASGTATAGTSDGATPAVPRSSGLGGTPGCSRRWHRCSRPCRPPTGGAPRTATCSATWPHGSANCRAPTASGGLACSTLACSHSPRRAARPCSPTRSATASTPACSTARPMSRSSPGLGPA